MRGVLDGSGIHIIGPITQSANITASLTSSDAGRKIELSINGGNDYFEPQYDVNEAGQLGVVIKAHISHIKFTGAQGDDWVSLS